jgi:hypothetical protein
LFPCVASNEEFLYFKELGLHNKSVNYFLLNRKTNTKKMINSISDDKSFIAVDDFYQRNEAEQLMSPNTMDDNAYDVQRAVRQVQRDKWFYEQILSSPVYYPMFYINDSLYIFNHLADSAFVYDKKGQIKRTFAINHHLKNGWKSEILYDKDVSEIYAKYIRRGLVYLSKINLLNGKCSIETSIKNHIYPEKLKIKDGIAYYIFNNTKDQSKRNVYMLKL